MSAHFRVLLSSGLLSSHRHYQLSSEYDAIGLVNPPQMALTIVSLSTTALCSRASSRHSH